ncbi:nitrilase cyanide hydratase and apolipo N-acyltransferase family protein [Raphidocelis subcapitata]|uniref:Nitrilase cyanide hydratase and apolipo N-acyltransferase family protein n=1 Tax=Raphidocelis subcapitata TaxID=307507 RepID=A0A2V0NQX2_9CHLO|nr:nitrilase cyanide hydratase and apolipo N-acyltransferase family protein [Raphidocelis subcapitata]|eukprot:GBF87953.1 nitrilase cyanide hydratase and apolipo N-acyltransferase family protein [Raphidocelis subcapitata]
MRVACARILGPQLCPGSAAAQRLWHGGAALGRRQPSAAARPSYSQQHPQQRRRSLGTVAMASADGAPGDAPSKVKIALCQLSVTADKPANIAAAAAAVGAAAAAGAGLVVLPEMWNCPYSNDSFPSYAEDFSEAPSGGAPSYLALSAAAAAAGVTVVGGSVPEREGGQLFNTCCVFGPDGQLLAKHRKVHLFDIDIPGKMTFKESLTLSPGGGPTVVDTPAGRLGVGICYDIRFPELAMVCAKRGAQLIVYPGAFNMVTGPVHWELLAKARAVDNQLFVATCSPARSPEASYQAWGHSTVVGPFAEVLATCEHEPATVFADIDYGQIAERRANMPLTQQRRSDLYELVDKTAA